VRQIQLETSVDDLDKLHKTVNGDGRKKTVIVSKNMLSKILIDHTRLVAYLGPVVKEPED
jgi:hypothetical protein